jgi:hypothetical protein
MLDQFINSGVALHNETFAPTSPVAECYRKNAPPVLVLCFGFVLFGGMLLNSISTACSLLRHFPGLRASNAQADPPAQ